MDRYELMARPLLLISLFAAFLFCAATAEAAWYDTNYGYCRAFTATAGSSGIATTTSSGFTLVATTTLSQLAATSSSGRIYELDANSEPVDFVVTSGTDCASDPGTKLDFYFEEYNSSTGAMTLWVEADTVSSTTAKTLLMYYGYSDASATSQQNETGTWGSLGEVGVWNLNNDPTGTILDSTANNLDGSTLGSMTSGDLISGKLGQGLDLDGSNDVVVITDAAALDVSYMTVSAWVRKTSANLPNYGAVVTRQQGSSFSDLWGIFYRNSTNDDILGAVEGQTTTSNNSTVADINKWTLYTLTYNGTSVILYRNGVQSATVAGNGTTIDAEITPICIGANSNGGSHVCNQELTQGEFDDVRYYGYAMSPADILTVYNNTNDSASFWSFGGEQSQPPVISTARSVRLLGGVRLRGVRLF